MATPDMDVIKEIPGYKVILKAILKSQIQQLVEQLASTTDEESVILTASVSDGTLSHLGSDSGKNFLDDHEDIKSQFLGFCLKRHHRQKQEKERAEKEKQQEEAMARQRIPTTPTRYGGPRPGFMPQRSPRFSPRHPGIHPVALTRASPRGVRQEPYPRPPRRPSLNFDPRHPGQVPMRLPIGMGNKMDGQVIKIEADDPDDSNQSDNANTPRAESVSSPSQATHSSSALPSIVKSEAADHDEDAQSESSSSTIPNEASDLQKLSEIGQPPEGLSLDSDLSGLISNEGAGASVSIPNKPHSENEGQEPTAGSSGEMDPNVNVKVEAITESEMELEITGVELGHGAQMGDPMGSQESWAHNSGATGSQGDMPQGSEQGYTVDMATNAGSQTHLYTDAPDDLAHLNDSVLDTSKDSLDSLVCDTCGKSFATKTHLKRHLKKHSSEAVYECTRCTQYFPSQEALDEHKTLKHDTKPHLCSLCGKSFMTKANLRSHNAGVHSNAEGVDKSGLMPCPFKDCKKVFSQKEKYIFHLNIHTGDKPYSCLQCGKAFQSRYTKAAHEQVCLGLTRTKCDVCNKVFSDRTTLSRHRETQHFDERHICVCGQIFSYRSSLSRHKKKKNH